MESLLASAIIVLSPILLANTTAATGVHQEVPQPEMVTTPDYTASAFAVKTQSRFTAKEEIIIEEISYATEYTADPETEYGLETVTRKGVLGQAVKTYRVDFWEEEEIGRELIKTEITPPQSEIIARGTKIIWHEVETSDGIIKYWRKLNVRATSYDASCDGCTGRTYSGTEVRHGVCATDPKVIQLGTWLYVPGYGACHAEDIGGAIKGNKIDLGWEDVRNGWWSTRFVEIYLTTGMPE